MSRKIVVVLLTSLLASAFAVPAETAAESIDFDLATQARGTTERRTVQARELTITLVNRVMTATYAVDLEKRVVPIPPLDLRARVTASFDCASVVDTFVNAVKAKTTEAETRTTIEQFRARIASCDSTVQAEFEGKVREGTTVRLDPIALRSGQEVVVTVSRNGQTWTRIFSTGSRGEWRTSYGFTFLPNGNEEFFAKQDETDDSMFIITKKEDREDLDFAPSIFFSFMPRANEEKNWVNGPVAGIGYDFENPILFGGWGWTYNHNVTFTLGASIHQQKRLDGRYSIGDTLSEILDSDALNDDTYAANLYFGISFRFGRDPFSSNQGSGGNSNGSSGGSSGSNQTGGDPSPVDTDGDGVADDDDNCPNVANDDQTDNDGNGVGDACEGSG